MRKQYHFRKRGEDTLIWDVNRLVELSAGLPRRRVAVEEIRELDEPYWFEATGTPPTCRAVIEHVRLIGDADPGPPVILSSDGRVMDGMHRIAKACLEGRNEIEAVRFETDPDPDWVNRDPEDLPY